MTFETIAAFTTVALIAIASPGPAVLLALKNGIGYGARTAVWSSLGNISGVFCLSAATMLGLGAVLKSSTLVFDGLKIVGALYLLYIGIRHLIGRSTVALPPAQQADAAPPTPARLYREAILLAVSNPKPILFFTALFPQFIAYREPLAPQFFTLTGIFMVLSFCTLLGYATFGARARSFLVRPRFSIWLDRGVGSAFVAFGVALLALRGPVV